LSHVEILVKAHFQAKQTHMKSYPIFFGVNFVTGLSASSCVREFVTSLRFVRHLVLDKTGERRFGCRRPDHAAPPPRPLHAPSTPPTPTPSAIPHHESSPTRAHQSPPRKWGKDVLDQEMMIPRRLLITAITRAYFQRLSSCRQTFP